MQDFLTPKRNRLTIENLEACLLVHQAQEFDGFDFEVTPEMIQKYQNLGKKNEKMEVEKAISGKPSPIDKNEEIRLEKERNNRDTSPENLKNEIISYLSSLFIKTPPP